VLVCETVSSVCMDIADQLGGNFGQHQPGSGGTSQLATSKATVSP